MAIDHEILNTLLRAIDDANAEDPHLVEVDGIRTPLALAHGLLASTWMNRLYPTRPDEWLIAARAHHLRRWEYPRSGAPPGRAGYLNWRAEQKRRHGAAARNLAVTCGVGPDTAEAIARLITRAELRTDPGQQAVEDSACFAFVLTQLASVSEALGPDRLHNVLVRTINKMTPTAVARLDELPLDQREHAALASAIEAAQAKPLAARDAIDDKTADR